MLSATFMSMRWRWFRFAHKIHYRMKLIARTGNKKMRARVVQTHPRIFFVLLKRGENHLRRLRKYVHTHPSSLQAAQDNTMPPLPHARNRYSAEL